MYDATTAAQAVCRATCRGGDDHAISNCFRQKASSNIHLDHCKVWILATMDDDLVHGVNVMARMCSSAITVQAIALSVIDSNLQSAPNKPFGFTSRPH